MCQRLLLRGALLCSLMLCIPLLLPQQSAAASVLSLDPAGNGSFVLHGKAFTNVAGIDLAITYDSSKLSNPRLTQGPLARGAVTALNRNAPGTLVVSIIGAPAITGNGKIATVAFDQQGEDTGQISVRGSIIDTLGLKQPVLLYAGSTVDTVPPATSTVAAAPTAPAATSDQAGGGANGAVVDSAAVPARIGLARLIGGSVSPPAAEAPAVSGGMENRDRAGQEGGASTEPAEIQQPSTVSRTQDEQAPVVPVQAEAEQAASSASVAPQEVPSVLERFRTFTGQRSAAGFISLFAQGEHPCFHQDPPIGISTPGSVLALTIPRNGDKAPNFAFQGCQALSFRAGEGGWVLEVKPDSGAESATVVMLLGAIKQCPLTLAPAADVDLDGSGKVTEADFEAYLQKAKGEAAIKRRDLNNDGRLDYHDDYIFTANYLAAGKKVSK
ncbi:hypothetical protein M1B72_11450 [Geomonas paludis]|uniref:EF-hand domain-containing protein n=1 Tax=Geomonas paludis TaxID=2740185 RepID=A0A6V8MZI1_9BACT|nr:hypothetical protein [Geomonas paludis]UPU34069.1 hypothetical protein M1B72_11450 [Geomonas paludis]GFO65656.1 hypothetical protein GMPD_35750 [Geomonas paludis]